MLTLPIPGHRGDRSLLSSGHADLFPGGGRTGHIEWIVGTFAFAVMAVTMGWRHGRVKCPMSTNHPRPRGPVPAEWPEREIVRPHGRAFSRAPEAIPAVHPPLSGRVSSASAAAPATGRLRRDSVASADPGSMQVAYRDDRLRCGSTCCAGPPGVDRTLPVDARGRQRAARAPGSRPLGRRQEVHQSPMFHAAPDMVSPPAKFWREGFTSQTSLRK